MLTCYNHIIVESVDTMMATSLHSQENSDMSAAGIPRAIGVFWDIENCAVPHGKSALALVQRIRDRLFTGHKEVEFMCVCDTSKEHRDVIQELNFAQVTVVHIQATSKNAADDKIRQSLRRFANAYPPHSTTVLLSGDVNFVSELSDLRYRHHHHVVLVHSMHAQDALINCANVCYSFEEFTNGLPDRSHKKTLEGSTELLVSGLPRNRPIKALQQRLQLMSDNCGGKVINLSRSSALLNFPNVEAAIRAKKRLNDEDVYGCRILVDFAYSEGLESAQKPDTNIGYYSPKASSHTWRNRAVLGVQRPHSLSPEPGNNRNIRNVRSRGVRGGTNYNPSPHSAAPRTGPQQGRVTSPQRTPRSRRPFTRGASVRTQVYYGKAFESVGTENGHGENPHCESGGSPLRGNQENSNVGLGEFPRYGHREGSTGGHREDPRHEQEVPERDRPKGISNSSTDSAEKLQLCIPQTSSVDASTMTEPMSICRKSSNRSKKKLKASINKSPEKIGCNVDDPHPLTEQSTVTPGNEQPKPGNEQTKPQNKQTAPQNKQTAPQNKQTTPQNKQTTPQNKQTTPQNKQTTPQNKQTTPQNKQTTHKNEKGSPGNEHIPSGNEHIPPGNEHITHGNEHITPGNEQTAPQLTKKLLQENVTCGKSPKAAVHDSRMYIPGNDKGRIAAMSKTDVCRQKVGNVHTNNQERNAVKSRDTCRQKERHVNTSSPVQNHNATSGKTSIQNEASGQDHQKKYKQNHNRSDENKSPIIKSQVCAATNPVPRITMCGISDYWMDPEEQADSDVIVEEQSIEEVADDKPAVTFNITHYLGSQLSKSGFMIDNRSGSQTGRASGSEMISSGLPSSDVAAPQHFLPVQKSHLEMRPRSACADLLVYRSQSPVEKFCSSGSHRIFRGRSRTKTKPDGRVSPHHLTRPRPIHPNFKPSPIKYPGSYENTYYSNSCQYRTPPGAGKFNYYYQRNSYRSSGGYYSHFGSPGNFNSPGHSPVGNPEQGAIRDVADNFNRKKKMSREVLFLQQQIYQEDGAWPKGEGEEDYELQEDIDGYCRDECHSAPPLPYHRGYHYMTPEKSPYSSQSPHFRRTPGAQRPPIRPPRYSGDRPGSSMSSRSNSSNGSHGNFGYSEPGQFRPIRFESPHQASHDYRDDSEEVETEEPMTELMVSNLDYNISAREWRKILYAEFHQHVQVLDVHILTQPDNTNIGYIKVPTIEEARFAISQFHRKKIGYKRIHVTIVNQDEDSVANAKTDVVTLLKEVPSLQLSLYKLMELYEKRFHHPITASELYSFQDVLEIVEFEGQGRIVRLLPVDGPATEPEADVSTEIQEDIVCTVHCPEGSSTYQEVMETTSVAFVTRQLRGFAAQLHTMLQGHTGCLPLLSFPICYRAEFGSLNIVPHGGVPLEHLISSVPGVRIDVTKSGTKRVQWAENKVPPAVDQTRLCNSPLLNQQLGQFSREVVELLKHTPQCRMPFNKFIPMYHHTLGRQCRVADYGYTKLIELFDAIPHIVQVIGTGTRKYVTLTHRAQMKRFALDILRVLKSQASKQISVLDLAIVYNKVLARPFDVTEYGLCYLEDILQELPENTVTVTGVGEEMILSIPRRDQTPEEMERTKQFALEVIDLLKHSPQCRMPFNRFIPAYHHHFGKQCRVSDYGFTKLVELFEAIPHVLKLIPTMEQSYSTKIIDEQEDKILMLVEPELLKVLGDQVMALLKSYTDHKLPVPEFLSSFTKFHGHSLRLQDYGVTSVVELIEKINRIAKVDSQDGKYIIKLVDHTHLQLLAHRVLLLLMEQLDGTMAIEVLQERYRQLFGYSLLETELEHDLDGIIQVTGTGSRKMIKLCPVQMFARDTRTLLRHHHGKLPLSQFEAAYANHFGVHLVPASYGYPSTITLLQAVPHVVQLRGKSYNITVLLCQDFQGKLFAGASHTDRSSTPLPAHSSTSNGLPQVVPMTCPTPDHQQCEPELMSMKSARSSPNDLLSVRVPSGVPSPDLHPAAILTPSDLIKFDTGGAVGVNELFSGLSPDEKHGQKTPLCNTPVSDMLQFAAQLLPISPPPLPPQSGQSLNYIPPYPQYNSSYPGQYMYNVPPVPTNAPHVAALEQQMNNAGYSAMKNYAGYPHNQDIYSASTNHQDTEVCQSVLAANSSGTLSFEPNVDGDLNVGCLEQASVGPGDLSPVGGTLFWMKNEDHSGGVMTRQVPTDDVDVTRVMPAGCESPVRPVVTGPAAVQTPAVAPALPAVSPDLNPTAEQVSTPSRPSESRPMGESPKSPSQTNTAAVEVENHMNQSISSEPFQSPCDSSQFTITDRLGKTRLNSESSSPNKTINEYDGQHVNQDLRDSGIASPGGIRKTSGSGTEEDGSVTSSPSPKKLGTPRKSRLAAKFMASTEM